MYHQHGYALRNRAAGDPEARVRDLVTRSYWLTQLGRREEVLTADNEAVTSYRQLAGVRPDAHLPDPPDLPDLAAALNNQSNRLAGLGRPEKRWPRSRKPSPSAASSLRRLPSLPARPCIRAARPGQRASRCEPSGRR